MVVKIVCVFNASFEIKEGVRHPEDVSCPNCGRVLPDNASQDLFTALNSFALFETKLGYKECYEVFISK